MWVGGNYTGLYSFNGGFESHLHNSVQTKPINQAPCNCTSASTNHRQESLWTDWAYERRDSRARREITATQIRYATNPTRSSIPVIVGVISKSIPSPVNAMTVATSQEIRGILRNSGPLTFSAFVVTATNAAANRTLVDPSWMSFTVRSEITLPAESF